jgi:flagellin
MLSIQTNVNSLIAQQNLSTNNAFQARTIQRLTSGYRINSAGDDAAGLAVANGLRDSVAELTQGVQNGNNGVAQLQIMDGGLSNISNILDRLQTLATESASTTFTGQRSTLNAEYQNLLGEIDRQATNVNLNTGGTYEKQLNVYLGGASSADSNAQVSVNLANSAVDTKGLQLTSTSVMGGGTGFGTVAHPNTANMGDTQATFDIGTDATTGEKFTVGYVNSNGAATQITATMTAQAAGYSGADYVTALNTALKDTGVTAMIGGDGTLQFQGGGAFTVQYSILSTGPTSGAVIQGSGTPTSLVNTGNYNVSAAFQAFTDGTDGADTQDLIFSSNGTNTTVHLSSAAGSYKADNIDHALTVINQQLTGTGIQATYDAGGKISFQSSSAFTVNKSNYSDGTAGSGDVFETGNGAPATTVTAANSDASVTGAALSAINSVTAALTTLGKIQGTIGAGENQLNYGITLAQSQITNFDSAQSQIRDTDVAAEAANLSKAQVLQQASIAAMAQANSAPQQVLSLLRQ